MLYCMIGLSTMYRQKSALNLDEAYIKLFCEEEQSEQITPEQKSCPAMNWSRKLPIWRKRSGSYERHCIALKRMLRIPRRSSFHRR